MARLGYQAWPIRVLQSEAKRTRALILTRPTRNDKSKTTGVAEWEISGRKGIDQPRSISQLVGHVVDDSRPER